MIPLITNERNTMNTGDWALIGCVIGGIIGLIIANWYIKRNY